MTTFPHALDNISGRAIRPEDCGHPDECDCELISLCPACGEPSDYCQGHGPIGDAFGAEILNRHDTGAHELCHPDGCDWAHAHEAVIRADRCHEDERWPSEPDHVRRSWCLIDAERQHVPGVWVHTDPLPSGEPRCDVCGLPQDYPDAGAWDAETGCHSDCEEANEAALCAVEARASSSHEDYAG